MNMTLSGALLCSLITTWGSQSLYFETSSCEELLHFFLKHWHGNIDEQINGALRMSVISNKSQQRLEWASGSTCGKQGCFCQEVLCLTVCLCTYQITIHKSSWGVERARQWVSHPSSWCGKTVSLRTWWLGTHIIPDSLTLRWSLIV